MAGLQPDVLDELAASHVVTHNEYELRKEHPELEDASARSFDEPDGIHDGLEFPTEEERLVLRRVSDTLPWASYLIAFVELAERFSYYGASVVFTNYIQQPLPDGSRTGAGGGGDGQSGALGKGQQIASGLTTFYGFWAYVVPLLGAYIADAHWGRYKTICWAVVVAFIGHIILIVSAVPGVIEKTEGATACFVIGMIVTGFALGTGLFKPNISPLVAEQYRKHKLFIRTLKSGERVVVDPVYTVSRVYMYFYLFTNIGALVGQISMTYAEKFIGFWLAYTLPTVVFFLCPIVLFFGRNRYQRSPPEGSVLGTALRLFAYAARGRWSWNPVRLWKNFNTDDFWEGAKPSHVANKPEWMTFDDKWVDEVRRGLKACAVFIWYPLWWLSYDQLTNNLISQAATMDVHGLPNDVLSNLDPLALIIFIPICDIFFFPFLKRLGLNFTALKKITAGFFTGALAMVWAAVVQHYIYKTDPCGNSADSLSCDSVSPLNVWIQTGSYVLIAFSEIFASITGLEYAFTKAPKNMRSLVMSVFFFQSALGSALSEAWLPLLNDPLLTWNYASIAIIASVGGCFFWLSVRNLDVQEDKLNNLATGHMKIREPMTNEKSV
ncbi:PTR2-domain-containing protein [Lentinula aciculospora]|uniref:PTR2-domain-containing protein n=1 Tax=Lentinula aciculospora TaxID=153920 RepID=A0A9W9A617_9AGAR|nr:PTR2-domain-containing protein [Lentinula aciculospora]